MTRYTKIAAAAAAALLAAPVFAAMTTDANLELDSDYRTKITPKAGSTQPARDGGMSQGGRVEFNVAGKAGDAASGFVAGRGTLLIKKDGSAGVDDMWGQIGMGMVDVKLGRFEATDMFPPGKDTLVEDGANAAPVWGRTNLLRGRMGSNIFHGALTVNPGSGVGIEVGVVESKTVGTAKGLRPVVSFAAGPVTVKVGAEIGKFTGGQKFNNFGATVGGTIEGAGFNVNVATGKLKALGAAVEQKVTSLGANATFGPAGVGLILDTQKAAGRKAQDTTIYAAYSVPLFNTGATLTPALSHQMGKLTGGGLADDKYKSATAVRVRLNYTF